MSKCPEIRVTAVLVCGLLVMSNPASAGDPDGKWQVRAGVTGVIFDDDVTSVKTSTGVDLQSALGADAKIGDVVVPTLTVTYFLTPNIAIEGICCTLQVKAEGTNGLEGAGDLVEAWVLPPAITAQYRFDRRAGFQPYVGAGFQWVHYWADRGDNALGARSVDIDDSFGLVLQAGIDYALWNGWSLNLDVKKSWIDTTITWKDTTLAGGADIKADLELDPLWVTASLGYRFNSDDLFGRRSQSDALK
jgi:outer membrane protein